MPLLQGSRRKRYETRKSLGQSLFFGRETGSSWSLSEIFSVFYSLFLSLFPLFLSFSFLSFFYRFVVFSFFHFCSIFFYFLSFFPFLLFPSPFLLLPSYYLSHLSYVTWPAFVLFAPWSHFLWRSFRVNSRASSRTICWKTRGCRRSCWRWRR